MNEDVKIVGKRHRDDYWSLAFFNGMQYVVIRFKPDADS
jgi:hypothetical protein